jgi:hypothetical protein
MKYKFSRKEIAENLQHYSNISTHPYDVGFSLMKEKLLAKAGKPKTKPIEHLDPELQWKMHGKALTSVANKVDEIIERLNSLSVSK